MDFGQLAESYDRLRADHFWPGLVDAFWEEGDLLGRRVLDVGCGTGTLAAALAERGAKVWGVDSSAEMLARARERAGRAVGFKQGRAEALPFRDGWFERAVLRLVVHLVDRDRALPELARVLGPGGRAVGATFRAEHFDGIWLARYFPSLREIDRARFPEPAALARELEAAGFASVRTRALTQPARVGRYISTLWLISDDEYRAGLERAERELPAETAYSLEWALLVAERPLDPGSSSPSARLRLHL